MRHVGLLLMLFACASRTGGKTPGAPFLEVYPDARTTALGNCGTALSSLESNTYYNPAVLGFAPQFSVAWSHLPWLTGIYPGMSYDFASACRRLRSGLGVGGSMTYRQTGESEVTDENGNCLGQFRAFDVAAAASAGYRLRPSLALGASAKAIYSLLVPRWVRSIYHQRGRDIGGEALTAALDAGVQYHPWSLLGLGLSIANAGFDINYGGSDPAADPLPLFFRLGGELAPKIPGPVQFSLVMDISRDLVTDFQPHSDSLSLSDEFWKGIGLELKFAKFAKVRLGYFEDILGERGGILVRAPGDVSRRIGLVRFLTRNYVGQVYRDGIPWGFCWGVGLRFSGISVDVGVDENIYNFPTRNARFQLSYRF